MDIKKFTQKDRYGNQTSYEFEHDVKPIDQTKLIEKMMEGMMGEGGGVPEMEMQIPGGDHPGEPRGSDTVPAWLTPGEFVVNAEAMRIPGAKQQIEDINNKGRAMQQNQGGSIPGGYNTGGSIPAPFIAGPRLNDPVYADGGGWLSALSNIIPQVNTQQYQQPLTQQQIAAYKQAQFEKMQAQREAQGFDDGGWVTDELLDKLRQVESGGDNKAVSSAGAVGAYQWLPSSAAQAGYNVKPFDPLDEKAARAATKKYLQNMQAHHGFTKEETLRAYNWGPGNVIKHKKGIRKDIPDEAFNYAGKILGSEGLPTVSGPDVPQPIARPPELGGKNIPVQEQVVEQEFPQPPEGGRPKAPVYQTPIPGASRSDVPVPNLEAAYDTGGDLDGLEEDIWHSGGEEIKSNWQDRINQQKAATEVRKNLPSNVVPELTDVPKGHVMFGGDQNLGGGKSHLQPPSKENYRFQEGFDDTAPSFWKHDAGLEDSGGTADGSLEQSGENWWEIAPGKTDETISGSEAASEYSFANDQNTKVSNEKAKVNSVKVALDRAEQELGDADPFDNDYEEKIQHVKNLKENLNQANEFVSAKSAKEAANKKTINNQQAADLQGKISKINLTIEDAIKNGDIDTAEILEKQLHNLETKVATTPNTDDKETVVTKKRTILDKVIKKTDGDGDATGPGNDQKGEVKSESEVIAEGEKQTTQEKGKAEGFLKSIFGDLFDKKELTRMAIMYAGSRALGYSHNGSLGFAAKQYVNRVDTKVANKTAHINKLISGGKYKPASIEAYKESGDVNDLKPIGDPITKTGNFKNFYKNGKRIRATEVKSGKSAYWITPDGKQVNASYTEDASIVRGTPEYSKRIKADSATYTGMIKDLRSQFGTIEVEDGADQYKTELAPSVSGGDIARWAAENNVPAELMPQVVNNAYHNALQHSAVSGKKVRDLTSFLNDQFVIATSGSNDLFKDPEGNTVAGPRVSALIKQVTATARNRGKAINASQAVAIYRKAWNDLDDKARKDWQSKSQGGTKENGFMKFMEADLQSSL